jgi:hypothetical protein
MADTNSDEKGFVARFSTAFLALIGATSQSDFGAKFSDAWKALVGRVESLETSAKDIPAAFNSGPLVARIEAMEAKLKDAPTKENVESWAKVAGSAEAAKAVGSVGVNAAAIAAATPTSTSTQKTGADALIAEGKYEEAFAALPADHRDRKEFSSAQTYAHYMRAVAGGNVAVYQTDKK